MLKRIIFVSVLSILSVVVFGQGKITLKEEKISDFVPQSLYKTKYPVGFLFKVADGEYQAIGYKGERLEEILQTDVAAYKEFKRFKRKVTAGKVSYWVGFGGLVVLPLAISDNDSIEQAQNKRIAGLVLGIGGTITYLLANRSAKKHLLNSVEIYNQNLEK